MTTNEQQTTAEQPKRQRSERNKYFQWFIQGVSYAGIAFTIWACWKLYQMGAFTDPDVMMNLVKGYGVWAPIIFMFIQIIQVVIPIIPGGITLAVGVMIFGPWWGFVYNYVGIVVGSFILFWLGRRYGMKLVEAFVSDKVMDKYMSKLDTKGWRTTFAIMILLPVAPDDALVLLTSLTKMSWREFFWIIVLCKPATVAAYSFAMMYGMEWLTKLIG
ncbi:TVP38/TMEM64 family protein [Weissella ceti]|uniref:TVP38/TMEM64 family membrane protein n=1 Tax=Weissella ceti TaxID=759620 RepID=A0ABT3E515_9LACO|nr:TVP38/TMEM64 family protein [Weissella ceti]MCW0953510.1 TVP38/TMEM64 family protein [Weissella ceti]QVK12097.1 TVP38/TMEM64 family protein [Weissella ceti]